MNAPHEQSTRRIDLEIRRAVEPIHGVVHEGGRSMSFSGWLGLAGALGRLVGSGSDRGVPRAEATYLGPDSTERP